jgi:hypothetical protein
MDNSPDSTGLFDAARDYAERGLPIIPLRGKVPAIRRWQEFIATEIALRFWFGTHRCNIGLRTGESGYVVLDTDTPEAERWVTAHCPVTPMQTITGSGTRHHYYGRPPQEEVRNKQALHGIDGLDVRGHGGFIVVPPSIHPETGNPYAWSGEFRHPSGLPEFSPAWVYQETRHRVQSVVVLPDDPGRLLDRGRCYVAKFERAISGKNGHTTTLKSAFKILRFVGFNYDLAWHLMLHYNATRCDPPWLEIDLKRKLDEALRLSSR